MPVSRRGPKLGGAPVAPAVVADHVEVFQVALHAGEGRAAVHRAVDDHHQRGTRVAVLGGEELAHLVEPNHRVLSAARGPVPPNRPPRAAAPQQQRLPTVLHHERGTWIQGTSLSLRTSPGRPSTRSPRMFLAISVVPPSIELARARKKACWGFAHCMAFFGRSIV